jgi:hypothetical protein
MIWFGCKQCGKVHGRPEHSVGAMVFCDCGQGLTVPWESTAAEPPSVPILEPRPPSPAEPLRYELARDESSRDESRRDEPPRGESSGREPSRGPAPRRPRRGPVEPDPSVCFNHEAAARKHVCHECELSFCAECVMEFRGKTVCGPCKNYLVKLLQRPPRVSPLALACLMTALVTAPALFCFLPLGRSWGSLWLTFLALVPHAAAIVMGAVALRRLGASGKLGGRPQAITGIVIASVAAAVTVAVTATLQRWGT